MDKAELIERLEGLRDWPDESYERRTEDGYPQEMVYDEYAYKRMVDGYREALDEIIQEAKE